MDSISSCCCEVQETIFVRSSVNRFRGIKRTIRCLTLCVCVYVQSTVASCTVNVTARNKERHSQLINGCHQAQAQARSRRDSHSWKYLAASSYDSIFVDDKRHILYCAVPKVASTNWKRVMLLLTGKVNVTRLEDIQGTDVHHRLQNSHLVQLSRFKPDQIRKRINTYFKFLFVRHPLERIVSAYENKFFSPYESYFRVRYGTHIVRQFRSNPSKESLRRGHDVTFSEFVRYLGSQQSGQDWDMNEHWKPMSKLCMPCQIFVYTFALRFMQPIYHTWSINEYQLRMGNLQVGYDVIGKYETLREDAQLVFDFISATATADKRANPLLKAGIHFPAGRKRANRTMDVLKRFATVSAKNFKLMSHVYADDFKIFGYGYRFNKNGTLSGYGATSGSGKQCV